MVMIALVFYIGTDHPPTKDDDVPSGCVRTVIGCLALLIPVFCFAPWLFIFPAVSSESVKRAWLQQYSADTPQWLSCLSRGLC